MPHCTPTPKAVRLATTTTTAVAEQEVRAVARLQDARVEALERLQEPDPGEQADHRDCGLPLLPEHDIHELGRDDDQPEHRGHRDRADHPIDAHPGAGDPFRIVLQLRERREEHLDDRPCEPADRGEHHVVRQSVRTERRRTEIATDQQVVCVAVDVEQDSRQEDVAAEAEHRAKAGPREDEMWPPRRCEPDEKVETTAMTICCPTIAQAP